MKVFLFMDIQNNEVDGVTCAICGNRFRTISHKHLTLKHDISLKQYVLQYPDYPINSQRSIQAKKDAATRANASRKGVKRSAEIGRKISETKIANHHTAWNKDIAKTQEEKSHQSTKMLEKYSSGEIVHWNTGKKTSQYTKDKISQTSLSQNRIYAESSLIKRTKTLQQMRDDGWIPPSNRPEVIELRRLRYQHLYGVDNHMQCHIDPITLSLLGDRDWLYEQHVTLKKPITTICSQLGMHWKNSNIMVKMRLRKYGIAQQYDFSCSYPERELRSILDNWGIQYIANDRTAIRPKDLDIYIPSLNIAIEYDGLIWHSSAFQINNYHKNKYDLCKQKGIRLITIFEDEWLHARNIVENKLKRIILGPDNVDKVFARKCYIKQISSAQKKDFLNSHHIQGDGPSSINIGLYHNDGLVAVMIFKHTEVEGEYILNRYATSCNVIGGFSKLSKYFERVFNPSKLISFADLRWSEGDVYTKNGYELNAILPPDYAYVDKKEITRIHKFNFRRKNLSKLLDVFDPALSETENCTLNGWHRIYNCGLLRFVRNFTHHSQQQV
jgi:hypothetical protein